MISQIIFIALFGAAVFLFTRRILFIRRNILMGNDVDRSDRSSERWMTMARVALGQSKMVARPVAGILHIFVYVGFVIINIEMLEIIIDGILGTHRIFASALGGIYTALIAVFEYLAFAVLASCLIFLVRRHVLAIARFKSSEMKGWPSLDATLILIAEVSLMFAFLSMNAADMIAMGRGLDHYHVISSSAFPVSQFLVPVSYTHLTLPTKRIV